MTTLYKATTGKVWKLKDGASRNLPQAVSAYGAAPHAIDCYELVDRPTIEITNSRGGVIYSNFFYGRVIQTAEEAHRDYIRIRGTVKTEQPGSRADSEINEARANALLIEAAPVMLDALLQWQRAEATDDPMERVAARYSRDEAIAQALGERREG